MVKVVILNYGASYSREHSVMSRDIFDCHGWERRVLMASSGGSSENILECAGQWPITKRILWPQMSVTPRIEKSLD